MYTFIKTWVKRGTTIHAGVSLVKGEFIVTDDTVSLKGSNVFSEIPKEYLTDYKPTLPTTKAKKKSV